MFGMVEYFFSSHMNNSMILKMQIISEYDDKWSLFCLLSKILRNKRAEEFLHFVSNFLIKDFFHAFLHFVFSDHG